MTDVQIFTQQRKPQTINNIQYKEIQLQLSLLRTLCVKRASM